MHERGEDVLLVPPRGPRPVHQLAPRARAVLDEGGLEHALLADGAVAVKRDLVPQRELVEGALLHQGGRHRAAELGLVDLREHEHAAVAAVRPRVDHLAHGGAVLVLREEGLVPQRGREGAHVVARVEEHALGLCHRRGVHAPVDQHLWVSFVCHTWQVAYIARLELGA